MTLEEIIEKYQDHTLDDLYESLRVLHEKINDLEDDLTSREEECEDLTNKLTLANNRISELSK